MAQLFSDERVRFAFTISDGPKKTIENKHSPSISPSSRYNNNNGKKLNIGIRDGVGSQNSSSKTKIGSIGNVSLRSPMKNTTSGNNNSDNTDKNNKLNSRKKKQKTLIRNPSVDFGSMTSLLNKNNPNVVSHSQFVHPQEEEEKVDNHEHFNFARKHSIEEQPSLEPAAILAPSQRQQYFERPAIRSRIRFNDYQNHRVLYGGRRRPQTAQTWNSSIQCDKPTDFRKDMESASPHRVRPRSTRRRRELTGKAIHEYNQCVARPTMSKKEMKQPWNRTTRTANFKSALESQKGRRSRYAYGASVKVYKGVAYTLDEDEQLGMLFDGQVGRTGKSPTRGSRGGKGNSNMVATSNRKNDKNHVKSKANLNDTKYPGNTIQRNIIDESIERIGNKTFRLLPYESARKEYNYAPNAGFVMDRKVSYDRIKVLRKVNLGGRKEKRSSRRRHVGNNNERRRMRKEQIIGRNRLNA
jgi:hypothetical protein